MPTTGVHADYPDIMSPESIRIWEEKTRPRPSKVKGFRVRCGQMKQSLGKPCSNVLVVSRWMQDPTTPIEGIPTNQVFVDGSESRPHLALEFNEQNRLVAVKCNCGNVWRVDWKKVIAALVGHPGWHSPNRGWVDVWTSEL